MLPKREREEGKRRRTLVCFVRIDVCLCAVALLMFFFPLLPFLLFKYAVVFDVEVRWRTISVRQLLRLRRWLQQPVKILLTLSVIRGLE